MPPLTWPYTGAEEILRTFIIVFHSLSHSLYLCLCRGAVSLSIYTHIYIIYIYIYKSSICHVGGILDNLSSASFYVCLSVSFSFTFSISLSLSVLIGQILPGMVSSALVLTVSPSLSLTTHQYTPSKRF